MQRIFCAIPMKICRVPNRWNTTNLRFKSDPAIYYRHYREIQPPHMFKYANPYCSSWRHLHCPSNSQSKESSKVEETVKSLKTAEKIKQDKEPAVPTVAPKRSLLKRVWDELVHYYHGFRLMFIDTKVSSRLVWKVLHGGDLTRREHKQLVRTVSDLFRLVPFSVFIIIPFMELLLPVFLKLFPAMLPSTFITSSDKKIKLKKELKVQIEMAKFLQDTLDNMAVKAKGEAHSQTAKEFAVFFEKIRTSGDQASNNEILKFSKLFEDEITLDSLARPQLIALCRLLDLQPIGTNNFLRFQLRMKLRSLKADDQMIAKEGIECLTVSELQVACKTRGMRALGVTEDRLRSQLLQWLELSLNEHIPPSLLLLSRALYLPDTLTAPDQLKATLSSLPGTAATEAKLKIGEREGKVDNKTKLELIRQEEEEIKKEEEEYKQELLEKQKKEDASKVVEMSEALSEIILDTSKERTMKDRAVVLDDSAKKLEKPLLKIKEGHDLSKEDFDNLEDALENISSEKKKLLIETEVLEDLKEHMEDYQQDVADLRGTVLETGHKEIHESKAALRLSNKVNKMISKMDKLLVQLSVERENLQQEMDGKRVKGVSGVKERDGIITINELVLAIRRIQKSSDDTRLQSIADVLSKMDVDHDGAIKVDHVLKVIELLGKENVKVTGKQMDEIIELLLKEDTIQSNEKLQKKKQEIESKNKDNLEERAASK